MTDHEFKVEALKRLEGAPVDGSYWRHYKGGYYVVTGSSIMEDTLEPLVHYRSLEYGSRMTRTLKNWQEIVEGHRPRFVAVAAAEVRPGHPSRPAAGRDYGYGASGDSDSDAD